MRFSFQRLASAALVVAFTGASLFPIAAQAQSDQQPVTKPAPRPSSAKPPPRPRPPTIKPIPKPPGPRPTPPRPKPPPPRPTQRPRPPTPRPKPPTPKPPPRPPRPPYPKPPPKPSKPGPIWRPGTRPPIWMGPPNHQRPPGGWRPNYGWVPGYKPAWWGPTWRNRRPWLGNNRPWYGGTSVVAGLFGVSLFVNLVNQSIATNNEYVLVPNTEDVYLIVGSVYGNSGSWVSFNFVSYGQEYVEEGDCRNFTIDGSVPASANLRSVLNAACIVAYGT